MGNHRNRSDDVFDRNEITQYDFYCACSAPLQQYFLVVLFLNQTTSFKNLNL